MGVYVPRNNIFASIGAEPLALRTPRKAVVPTNSRRLSEPQIKAMRVAFLKTAVSSNVNEALDGLVVALNRALMTKTSAAPRRVVALGIKRVLGTYWRPTLRRFIFPGGADTRFNPANTLLVIWALDQKFKIVGAKTGKLKAY